MKSIKELRNEINESKQEDIADLKALLKNPDPKVAKNYGGIEGYKKMIQSKIDKLMKEETELEEAKDLEFEKGQVLKLKSAVGGDPYSVKIRKVDDTHIEFVKIDSKGNPVGTRKKLKKSFFPSLVTELEEAEADLQESKEEPKVIELARDVLENGAKKVKDPVTGKSHLLDAFSASAIVQIYEKLSAANQKKMVSMPLPKIVSVVFKLVNKSKNESVEELEEEAFKGESFLNKAEQYWGWFKVNKEKDYLSSASAFLNDFFNLYKNKGMMPKHAFKKATDLKGMISKELKKLGISESTEELDEALTRAQRIKRSQIAKRNKAKIQRALQKGKKKKASTETLQKRAKKKARDLLYTKLLKGRNRADVSAGEQERIEKKLDKMQGGINRIAKKLLPQLKKAEQEKLKKKSEE
jgi:hypothetical protein